MTNARFWSGLLLGLLLALAAAAGAVISRPATVLDLVLRNSDIHTLEAGKGRVWLRWNAVVFSEPQCWWVDSTKAFEGPKFGWTSLSNYLYMQKMYAEIKYGQAPGLTPEEKSFCFAGTPLPPVFMVKGATALSLTRPLYDGSLWESAGIWKPPIGVVEVNTKCESAVIRRTTVDYHYVTNGSGLRGLAVCR